MNEVSARAERDFGNATSFRLGGGIGLASKESSDGDGIYGMVRANAQTDRRDDALSTIHGLAGVEAGALRHGTGENAFRNILGIYLLRGVGTAVESSMGKPGNWVAVRDVGVRVGTDGLVLGESYATGRSFSLRMQGGQRNYSGLGREAYKEGECK